MNRARRACLTFIQKGIVDADGIHTGPLSLKTNLLGIVFLYSLL